MTDYVDVFSSDSIPPTGAAFKAVTLSANATFFWSYNYSGSGNTIAKFIEVSCSAGVTVTMPSAAQVSKGEDVLWRNVGVETLTLLKSDGSALTTVASGTAVLIYVTDNSTAAGTWGSFVYGAGTASADATSLAGYGLKADSGLLHTDLVPVDQSTLSITTAMRGKLINYTGGLISYAMDPVASFGEGFYFFLKNAGSSVIQLDPDGTEKINGVATFLVSSGDYTGVVATTTGWYIFGFVRNNQAINTRVDELSSDVLNTRQSVWIPAEQLVIDSSYGTAPTLETLSLTNFDVKILSFGFAANGRVSFIAPFPDTATYSETHVLVMWTRPTGTSSVENVVWNVSGSRIIVDEYAASTASDVDTLDAGIYTTEIVISPVPGAPNKLRSSKATFVNLELFGSGTVPQFCVLTVERNTTHASDTLNAEAASLVGIRVTYGVDSNTVSL